MCVRAHVCVCVYVGVHVCSCVCAYCCVCVYVYVYLHFGPVLRVLEGVFAVIEAGLEHSTAANDENKCQVTVPICVFEHIIS